MSSDDFLKQMIRLLDIAHQFHENFLALILSFRQSRKIIDLTLFLFGTQKDWTAILVCRADVCYRDFPSLNLAIAPRSANSALA